MYKPGNYRLLGTSSGKDSGTLRTCPGLKHASQIHQRHQLWHWHHTLPDIIARLLAKLVATVTVLVQRSKRQCRQADHLNLSIRVISQEMTSLTCTGPQQDVQVLLQPKSTVTGMSCPSWQSSQLPRLATGRVAVTNGYSHRMF